jgi:hypothetical protein
VVLAIAAVVSACGAPGEDSAEWAGGSSSASGGPSIVGGLANDMSALGDAGTDDPDRGGLPPELGLATSALSSTAAPAVVYLIYADGKSVSRSSPDPCPGTPPKFVCQFASSLQTCEEQIQAYLDRWYAAFNVVFTLTRPTSGPYYTEVVSSGGGAWCNAKDTVGGIAPFLCSDLAGGVSYTFAGGRTAKETAVIIAQEQAHLVGLEHTASGKDVMYPTICSDCDGFENLDNGIQGDVCGRTKQNSYQMMMDRLGSWTGGVKPTPFGCVADSSAPSVDILEPSDGAQVPSTFTVRAQASDDCKIAKATIRVTPMGLQATSTSAPFQWTLTKITGRQTVTITVSDPSGKSSTAEVVVNAPSAGSSGSGGSSGTGGKTASGTGGASASSQGGDDGAADAGYVLGDAAFSLHTQSPAGCEVGGCELAGTPPGVGSFAGLLAVGLLSSWALARRPPARRSRDSSR